MFDGMIPNTDVLGTRVNFSDSSIFMQDWLSSSLVMRSDCCMFNSSRSLSIHMTSCDALVAGAYSASVLDSAMQDFFLLIHWMWFLPNKNKFPLVDFLIWTSPGQYEYSNLPLCSCKIGLWVVFIIKVMFFVWFK